MDVLGIKNKIKQLDQGTFQNMCNEILYKEGYKNINQLGSHSLSNKTTKGTPDTFIKNGNEYIAVEYTTQENGLAGKIKEDVNKCIEEFQKSKISMKATKIFYFHTSSNIKLIQFTEIEEICNDAETNIKIYNIDEIAYILKYNHPIIAKDYLKIAVDTLQVLTLDDFIEQYNSNKLTVRINDTLLFRNKEISDISSIVKNEDCIMICGPSGTGKTHFCIELCRKYLENNKEIKVVCIRNNNLELYEDLVNYLNKDNEYLIFIDDANVLTNITQLLEYVKIHTTKKIKILMTVRDYAKNKILDILEKYFNNIKILKLNELTDEQIKEILVSQLQIKNQTYIEQIQKISLNNPRLAMMAGKVSKEKGFKEIVSGEQIYNSYFSKIIKSLTYENENKVIKSAGIIAFLNVINKENKEFKELLSKIDIPLSDFWDAVQMLNNIEYVDVLNDKLVKVSEQCLANYLLYFVFIKNKYISIKDIIEITFNLSRERMIESLNTITRIFYGDNTIENIKNAVKEIWDEIQKGKNKQINKQDFIKSFHALIPIETLDIIADKIDKLSIENKKIKYDEVKCITKEDNNQIKDKYLSLLAGYRDSEYSNLAIQLVFKFFKKQPICIKDIYLCIKDMISYKKIDIRHAYAVQHNFMDEYIKQVDESGNENLIILGLMILPIFLKTNGDYIENISYRKISIHQYTLSENESLRKIRNKTFDFLLKIYDKYNQHKNAIINIFNNLYINQYRNKTSKEIMANDIPYLKLFIEKLNKDNFLEILCANNILTELKQNDLEINVDNDITNNSTYKLYKTLQASMDDLSGEKREKIIKKLVEKSNMSELINVFKEIKTINETLDGEITKIEYSLNIFFREIFNNREKDNVQLIKEYILIGAPVDIDYAQAISILYKEYNFFDLYNYINQSKIRNKLYWQIACFSEIPDKQINIDVLNEFYNLIKTKINLTGIKCIDFHFLKKYTKLEKQVFVKFINIMIELYDSDDNMFYAFTNLLFERHYEDNAKFLINSFENDISKLIYLYFRIYKIEQHFDYDGLYFNKILQVEPDLLLEKNIAFRVNNTKCYNDNNDPIKYIWASDKCDKLIDNYLSKIDKVSEKYKRQQLLENVFEEDKYINKQDEWITRFIEKNSEKSDEIENIFEIISEFDDDRRLKFIQILINNNSDFGIFEKIPLTNRNLSWSGSEIPLIESRIKFYQRVKELLKDIRYIKHSTKIEKNIDNLKKHREIVKEEEFADKYI